VKIDKCEAFAGFALGPGENPRKREPAASSRISIVNYALGFWTATAVFALTSSMRGADVVSVWGGARETVILKSDGTIWTWGANFGGKRGIGDTNPTAPCGPGGE